MNWIEHVKILIVDDDAALRATLHEWLSLEGYDVHAATDGHEAMELVRWDNFDVVVTDLKMPRMDGLALLRRLLVLSPDARVIFLSGEATKRDVIEALREGRAFDFLEKPLHDLAHLSRAISRAFACRPIVRAPEPPEPPEPSGLDAHPALEAVFTYLSAHLSESIGLADVAAAVGYSPAYLTSLVRQATGQPVMQWVQSLRLKEACRQLEATDSSVAQVARAVGIPDGRYFSRLFKRAYGETPLAWRARSQGTASPILP